MESWKNSRIQFSCFVWSTIIQEITNKFWLNLCEKEKIVKGLNNFQHVNTIFLKSTVASFLFVSFQFSRLHCRGKYFTDKNGSSMNFIISKTFRLKFNHYFFHHYQSCMIPLTFHSFLTHPQPTVSPYHTASPLGPCHTRQLGCNQLQ